MNWKFSLIRSGVVGLLAFLGALALDIHGAKLTYGPVLIGLIDFVRDLLKLKFGMFETPIATARRRG